MNISILNETPNYWVIDKPAGLSVHPGAGDQITLTQIWADKYQAWKNLQWPDSNRPGIVHRLDKDTSGVMLIAKNPASLIILQELFSSRKIRKTYFALCVGSIKDNFFEVEASVSRDNKNRQKQTSAVLDLPWNNSLKSAKTLFELIEILHLNKYILSYLKCLPETGRMHQIRVHLKLKNLPIAGDAKYANKLSRQFNKKYSISRQMLHASKLTFNDPWENKKIELEAPLSLDFIELLKMLRHSQQKNS